MTRVPLVLITSTSIFWFRHHSLYDRDAIFSIDIFALVSVDLLFHNPSFNVNLTRIFFLLVSLIFLHIA